MTPEEQAYCEKFNNDFAEKIKDDVLNYIKENNGKKDSIEVANYFEEEYPPGIVYMAIDKLDADKKLGWNGEGIFVKEMAVNEYRIWLETQMNESENLIEKAAYEAALEKFKEVI